MPRRSEIAILDELIRATCCSADRCAGAARSVGEGYRRMAIEQLCDDRRRLVIDLIRCQLLRGVPEDQVRRSITGQPAGPLHAVMDVDVVWIDVEIAERKLHMVLRRALEDPALSEPVREVLSLHYLRHKLHHDALEGLGSRGLPLEDGIGLPMVAMGSA